MRNIIREKTHMTIFGPYYNMTSNNMDYSMEKQDSLEERCLAINELDHNQNEKIPVEQLESTITSMDLAQSQFELQKAIAESRRKSTVKPQCAKRNSSKNHRIQTKLPQETQQEETSTNVYSDEVRKRHPMCLRKLSSSRKSTDIDQLTDGPIDVCEQLRLANEKIAQLEGKVERLEDERTELRKANQMWARYAADLKTEHKKAYRSSSAGDLRNNAMSLDRVTMEIESMTQHDVTVTRKSEGDIDLRCSNNSINHNDKRLIDSLKSQISLLTQQVKIYKEDFTLERRDRVRSVMEAKKMHKEVTKLKVALSRQKHHAIKEQMLTCDDFDYLNQ